VKRAKKPKRPPVPWLDAVIFAVDTAQVSGWCSMLHGVVLGHGEVDVLNQTDTPEYLCRRMVNYATDRSLPSVLVYERPFRGTSQGQYVGLWKAAWVAAGGRKAAMVGVYPATHRARVLGGKYASAKREVVKQAEIRLAAGVTGQRDVGPDEAAAVCIALWASHAGEVADKLPKRRRKAA
jgi:hypothetical protein